LKVIQECQEKYPQYEIVYNPDNYKSDGQTVVQDGKHYCNHCCNIQHVSILVGLEPGTLAVEPSTLPLPYHSTTTLKPKTEYTEYTETSEFVGILQDIHMLSLTNFVVCTHSSNVGLYFGRLEIIWLILIIIYHW
jgi:hypothetical protein